MYYCGYMVLFSNVEMGIGLFASSLPAIRRLYLLSIRPERSQGSSQPPVINHDGLVTIGGGGAKKNAKAMARTTVLSVFSHPADRGHSETRVDSGRGSWERLTDGGSDNGSKTIRAEYSDTVEMHPVEPEYPPAP